MGMGLVELRKGYFMVLADPAHIRAITEQDLEQILQWRNDARTRKFMFNQEPIEVHAHKAWSRKVKACDQKFVGIVEAAGLTLGFVQFETNKTSTVADWGFYKNPDVPRGAGMLIGICALNHAFHTMGLQKVCARVLDFNLPSIAMHKRLGFVQEGLLRAQHRLGDLSYDVICYGLLSHEWRAANLAKGDEHEVN